MKLFISMALLVLGSHAALAGELVRCEFGKDECHAWIRACPVEDSECRVAFAVDCTGYEDGFLLGREKGEILVQGITSLRNPTPPSIVIDTDDALMRGNARVYASWGTLEGRCRESDN